MTLREKHNALAQTLLAVVQKFEDENPDLFVHTFEFDQRIDENGGRTLLSIHPVIEVRGLKINHRGEEKKQ